MRLNMYVSDCKFDNYIRFEYDRTWDKILFKPCCGLWPKHYIEPLAWDSDFFIDNIEYCINEYSKFDLRNLFDHYVGNCAYKNYYTNFIGCSNHTINKDVNLENSILKNCNLNCIMCRNNNGRHEKEDYLYLRTLKELQFKYNMATTCAGEPFTLKKELLDLVEHNVNTDKIIWILTNGTLLNESDIELLKKYKDNGSKFEICMSFDSDIPEVYEKIRRGAKFEVAYNNLISLAKNKLLSNVHYVIQELNLDSFLDTERRLKEFGIPTRFMIRDGDSDVVKNLDYETKMHILETQKVGKDI